VWAPTVGFPQLIPKKTEGKQGQSCPVAVSQAGSGEVGLAGDWATVMRKDGLAFEHP
jgi:hypothetical protein